MEEVGFLVGLAPRPWSPLAGHGFGAAGLFVGAGAAADTPTWYPEGLRERAHDFWDVAQKDILHDWMRETDPANLQPSVRPLNHRVAAFIRANPPFDISEERLNRALDILESPWPRRKEMLLRDWFDTSEHEGTTLSRFLIDRVLETGLEPVVSPQPLPPILPEDIDCYAGWALSRQTTALPTHCRPDGAFAVAARYV